MPNPPNPRLELTWIGKENRPRLEPRILLEDPALSYHAEHRTGKQDLFDNRLIFGDNLLALKALEQEFTGKVKCIYIDPPYNTGSAFEHYDDGVEHSVWLGLMRDRIELLWKLLCPDGLLAIQIDDNEYARLYLLLVEICGESKLKTISVKMSESTGVKMASVYKAGSIPKMKEYIILAKKDGIRGLKIEKIAKEKWDDEYKIYLDNVSQDEIFRLKEIIENEERTKEDIIEADKICNRFVLKNMAPIMDSLGIKGEDKESWLINNSWRIVRTVATTDAARERADRKREQIKASIPAFIIETKQKKAYIIKNGYESSSAQPRIKLLFADDYLTMSLGDLWTDIKTTGLDNEGGIDFKKGKKPEKLIQRIINMSTQPGDLVLDSFAGSGTTGAVAHKMGRRWIMIELGEHCHTHIIPRLKKVIDGEDKGGVTEAVGWKGGGGFRYYKLAPSLLQKDKWGNWIINKAYNPAMLAEAVCKLEGFTYEPSDTVYWMQGKSTESDYIYVTTAHLTQDLLTLLSDEVGSGRTLLVMCTAFRSRSGGFPNLTIKKIPNTVLTQCEWGHDDYSLQIENLPMAKKPQAELFEEEA